MVVDNVALLVFEGTDPAQASPVLVPPMPVEHPVRLADKHPETLISGFRMHEVTKGEGTEPLPLPTAQKGNPGVSEACTVHRRCLRGRRKVYLCHGLSIAASVRSGWGTSELALLL